MQIVRKMLILAFVALSLQGCRLLGDTVSGVRDLIGEEPVARVNSHKLYPSEIRQYIPDGLSPEDSAALALQYINSWAADKLFLDMAESKLSKAQKDVSREIDEYRSSLLKYRYEQLYISERMDTTVTEEDITDYYLAHKDLFSLDMPIVRARYLYIGAKSPLKEKIRKMMGSSSMDDLVEADSLARSSALKYFDRSDDWIDAVALAREFGTDYVSMLGAMRNKYIEMPDGEGNVKIAYIAGLMKEGETAPREYCVARIKDMILSGRKRQLSSGLERDLLEDARANEKFVIY